RVPTGAHVAVVREALVAIGGHCYSKRFLDGPMGDLRPWTDREHRVLERLARIEGAPVARLLPIPAAPGSALHTFDAGPTLDQWATRVVLRRNGQALDCLFEDCACWWTLARHCLVALDKLHPLGFVHLELKPDNICIPWSQPGKGSLPTPGGAITLRFEALTLIDVAFSLLPDVPMPGPLPLDRQPHYEYQSERLLQALVEGRRGNPAATRSLDWRCDLFSLAAMLWRYLPELEASAQSGWTEHRHAQAVDFVRLLVDAEIDPLPSRPPHAELIAITDLRLAEAELVSAMRAGFTFEAECAVARKPTPPTLIFRPAGAAVAEATPAHRALSDQAPVAAASVDLLLPDWPPAQAASVDLLLPDLDSVQPPPVHDMEASALSVTSSVPSPPAEDLQVQDTQSAEPGPTEALPGRIEPTLQSPLAQSPDTPEPSLADRLPPPQGRHVPRARRFLGPALTALSLVAAAAVAWWLVGDGRPAASVSGSTLAKAPTPDLAPESRLAPAPTALPASAAATAQAPSASATASVRPEPGVDPDAGSEKTKLSQPGPLPVETVIPPPPQPASSAPDLPAPALVPAPVSGDFDRVAARLMQGPIQRAASDAERRLAPVLETAKQGDGRWSSQVRAEARAARQASATPALAADVGSPQARRLNEAARVAYWQRNDVPEAVRLQTSAFGANPLDTEVVGNLAFLRLREETPDAEAARLLALHALTLKDSRFPAGRIQDWTTLAIASALTGREVDARNAWFVSIAVSNDLQSHCKAAKRASLIYGEALRSSVQAMLERARARPGHGACGSDAVRAPGSRSLRSSHEKRAAGHPRQASTRRLR
ncbi:MAG: hypothetical protein ABIO71_14015, partial [Caldimonas sp.]